MSLTMQLNLDHATCIYNFFFGGGGGRLISTLQSQFWPIADISSFEQGWNEKKKMSMCNN